MNEPDAQRSNINDFLTSRRARLRPGDVGLPAGNRRRVPGLRREEVAVLAGVSPEWYTRLEKGNIAGVSEDVLVAVATALRLNEEERTYLFELAHAARGSARKPARRKKAEPIAESVQWFLDSATLSAGFVRNGRLDVVASNQLGRALHAPMMSSETTLANGNANFARFHFLDPAAKEFFLDWKGGAAATAALLRAEAGREPNDKALHDLIGELSTLSEEFRTLWATHNIRFTHEGTKRIQHPVVGRLDLDYRSFDINQLPRATHEMSIYVAKPGSPSEEGLKMLSSWATAPHVAPTTIA
ncbi:helix-turn-helix transcriptional regulator [Glutamicibacter sp. JL.03c]|uniref:helix-turn-helix transcriptional regulator n=1 Tax=Glutamicibacter sp. JL.03c TaxID=2984842 RepID=UPI0021F7133D|nr:helix-turn-helix transcriptional regulator [Glutamicibacter sp. JL.03c]UYQ78513.1 helix-turn-helix transcriptional regulator [Glutamicibacter sp. JL.03c]